MSGRFNTAFTFVFLMFAAAGAAPQYYNRQQQPILTGNRYGGTQTVVQQPPILTGTQYRPIGGTQTVVEQVQSTDQYGRTQTVYKESSSDPYGRTQTVIKEESSGPYGQTQTVYQSAEPLGNSVSSIGINRPQTAMYK